MATLANVGDYITCYGGDETTVDILVDGLYLIKAQGGDGGRIEDDYETNSSQRRGGGVGGLVEAYVYLTQGSQIT